MRKLLVCSAIASCFMLNSFAHAQTFSSIHSLGKLPIVKAKGTGALDLSELTKSNYRLVFAVKNPKTGLVSYTHDSVFYGKNDGYYYQGQNRLQGYPVSSDILSNDCKLTDVKAAPEEIPALASTTIAYSGNLSASDTSPSVTPFDPTNSSTFNYTNEVTIYDSLGVRHNLATYYVKIAANDWTVNVYVDGISIGSGEIRFDGSGAMTYQGLGELTFDPNTGAELQEVNLRLYAFTQHGSPYSSNPPEADGMPTGLYSAYALDQNGYLSFNYSNGESITFSKVAIFAI